MRDALLAHRSQLNRYQKPEILHSVVSDHSGITLEISNITPLGSPNNLLLENPRVKKENSHSGLTENESADTCSVQLRLHLKKNSYL